MDFADFQSICHMSCLPCVPCNDMKYSGITTILRHIVQNKNPFSSVNVIISDLRKMPGRCSWYICPSPPTPSDCNACPDASLRVVTCLGGRSSYPAIQKVSHIPASAYC